MVTCSYCENEAIHTCSKCHRSVCNKHSHYKDHVFDNLYDANVAGHKYTYKVFCNECDVNFIAFEALKSFIAFIFVFGLLSAIVSLMIVIHYWW